MLSDGEHFLYGIKLFSIKFRYKVHFNYDEKLEYSVFSICKTSRCRAKSGDTHFQDSLGSLTQTIYRVSSVALGSALALSTTRRFLALASVSFHTRFLYLSLSSASG